MVRELGEERSNGKRRITKIGKSLMKRRKAGNNRTSKGSQATERGNNELERKRERGKNAVCVWAPDEACLATRA